MSKYKELLMKLGEETSNKIDEIRRLQKQIMDILVKRTPEELLEIESDPELRKLYDKLNIKIGELW